MSIDTTKNNVRVRYSLPYGEFPYYIAGIAIGDVTLGYGINRNKNKCLDDCLSNVDKYLNTLTEFRNQLLEIKERNR